MADGAVKTNTNAIATLNGKVDVAKVSTAIANAKSEASTDATSKANTAEANAKTYADGLNTAMDARVDALEAKEDKDTTYGAGTGLVLGDDNVFSIDPNLVLILDANKA